MPAEFYKHKNYIFLILAFFFILLSSHWLCCSASAVNSAITGTKKSSSTSVAAKTKQNNASGYFAPILTFHYISFPPENIDKVGRSLHVDPVYFEHVLLELQKNNYQTIFASQMAIYLQTGKKPPAKNVTLSFDDGYEDFYTNALPLLKKYQMRADLFVITNRNGGNYLTRDQIKKIDQSGLVEIGSHTVSHPSLPSLTKEEQLQELGGSKSLLEELLGKKINLICYPYGAYNQQVEILAKQVGYQYGFTYNHKPLHDTKDLFSIDRVSVWQGMDVIKFLDNLNKWTKH